MTRDEFYAADVRRWHACSVPELRDCGDTIQKHQLRCVGLVGLLVPMLPHTLMLAVRWHDQAEVLIGDLPQPAKIAFPDYAEACAKAEAVVIQRYDIPQPANDWERDVLKLVDRLDAYMTAVKYAPPDVLRNEEWMELLDEVQDRATSLGMLDRVLGILTAQKEAA